MQGPDYTHEQMYSGQVAGLDEVGRGPWAGPVVAAAVILDAGNIPAGLNDSKKLSSVKRELLFTQIMATANHGIGQASVDEIDTLNILEASMLAMRRALSALPVKPDFALVDGNRDPDLGIPTKCITKGDSKCFSIAAASIIAKVTRDEIMSDLAKSHPEYGWEQNAGYGVPKHIEALNLVGFTPHHRKSFAPIAKLINKEKAVTI